MHVAELCVLGSFCIVKAFAFETESEKTMYV